MSNQLNFKLIVVKLFLLYLINPIFSQNNNESWFSVSLGFSPSEAGITSYPKRQTAEINYQHRLMISNDIFFSISPGINFRRSVDNVLSWGLLYSDRIIENNLTLHSPILFNLRLNKLRLFKISLNFGFDISYPFIYVKNKYFLESVDEIYKISYFDTKGFQMSYEFGTNFSVNQNNDLGIKLAFYPHTFTQRRYSSNYFLMYPQLRFNHKF